MKQVFLFLFALTFLTTCQQEDSQKLVIATAANMQFAIEDLILSFTESTGINCEIVVSSSGKLTAQIREGAPFDIFLSADMKYPTDLFDRGLTTAPPKIYAYGQLVLWTKKPDLVPSLSDLSTDAIRHIALANPKTAPYGTAAQEVLRHHQLWDQLVDKLVYGESIAQTNQFINSGAATIGFTAKSVVQSPLMQGQGKWIEMDSSLYTPIAQGIVLLNKRENQRTSSQKFYNFLFSTKGKEILNTFGYLSSIE